MTHDEAPRPRMIPGLSHRYGDALTVEQLLAREAAERERAAARNAPPPEPPQLVTIGGLPPPAYRPPVAAPAPKPRPRRARPMRERAVSKLLPTPERALIQRGLSAEERKIIRGYRLSIGGPAAEAERRQIEREVRRR